MGSDGGSLLISLKLAMVRRKEVETGKVATLETEDKVKVHVSWLRGIGRLKTNSCSV